MTPLGRERPREGEHRARSSVSGQLRKVAVGSTVPTSVFLSCVSAAAHEIPRAEVGDLHNATRLGVLVPGEGRRAFGNSK